MKPILAKGRRKKDDVSIPWALWMTIVATILLWRTPTAYGSSHLQELWNLTEPTTTFYELTNTFVMEYDLHEDLVVSDSLRVDILYPDFPDCTYPALGTADGIVYETFETLDSNIGRHTFEIDPQTLSTNERLFNYTTDEAEVYLCLRSALWTGPPSDPEAREIKALEVVVTLYIDLTAGFQVDEFVVEFKDNGESDLILMDEYVVFAYRCDPTTLEESGIDVVRQGMLVTVCVEIEERAINDGIFLKGVDSFTWIREYPSYNVTQIVIEDMAAYNGLAMYSCLEGIIVCDFHSILVADFFLSAGQVTGYGMAHLTFGSLDDDDTTTTSAEGGRVRQLLELPPHQQDEEQQQEEKYQTPFERMLQQDPASTFGFEMGVTPVNDRPGLARTAGVMAPIRPGMLVSACLALNFVWIVFVAV
jgi:hypothetical protein